MTGMLIIFALVVLLTLALQPAHRGSWRPGLDVRADRDRARQRHELDLLATFDPAEPPAATGEADLTGRTPSAERHRSGRAPVLEHRRSTGREAFGEAGRAA